MSRRTLGMLSLAAGAALLVAGSLMLSSGGSEPLATTTTQLAAATTTAAQTTTTAVVTTTTRAVTTTTAPAETLEAFVESYRAALDSDDVEFIFGRLHPQVVEAFGADLCRAWVARVVVDLENYQLAGAVTGPADQTFTGPDGSQFAIVDTFSTGISFTFQGQDFQTDADFALVNGVMHWLGTCE